MNATEDRISQLERSVRRQQLVSVSGWILAAAGLAAGAGRHHAGSGDDVIRAQRIEVLSPRGEPAIVLCGADAGSPSLTLSADGGGVIALSAQRNLAKISVGYQHAGDKGDSARFVNMQSGAEGRAIWFDWYTFTKAGDRRRERQEALLNERGLRVTGAQANAPDTLYEYGDTGLLVSDVPSESAVVQIGRAGKLDNRAGEVILRNKHGVERRLTPTEFKKTTKPQ